MKRESRIVEAINDLVAMRNHRQDARDENPDTETTRSEFKLELPGRREEEETKNGNRNVKSHVKGNVTYKGKWSWMRLGVMDSDFWASRILVAWNPSRVPTGVGSVMGASFLARVWDLRLLCRCWHGNTWEGLAEEPERRLDWEVRMPQNRCVGSF